jgi:hypothetical protein
MKYTARHVQRFIDQGKIDPDLWKKHFPSVLETRVPVCSDCEEYKNTRCEGGRDPVDCLLSKQTAEDQISGSSASDKSAKRKSEANQWNERARGKKVPPGANKSFDQSKI